MPIQQGMNQQTPAAINTIRKVLSGTRKATGTRKRRKRRSDGLKPYQVKTPRASKSRGAGTRKNRRPLAKGSAAAKRFMAKLRAMKKK